MWEELKKEFRRAYGSFAARMDVDNLTPNLVKAWSTLPKVAFEVSKQTPIGRNRAPNLVKAWSTLPKVAFEVSKQTPIGRNRAPNLVKAWSTLPKVAFEV